MNSKNALPLNRIEGPISLLQGSVNLVPQMALTDPAIEVMTDFAGTAVFSIGQEVQIDQAVLYMKAVGVRFLFVVDNGGTLVGFVTAADILGDKPMRHLVSVDCTHKTCTRSEVLVKDIMSPVSHWEVINYADVEKAQISQVISSLKATGKKHLVVIEGESGSSESKVRGLISASRVEQATSMHLEIADIATSFAEIEGVLTQS